MLCFDKFLSVIQKLRFKRMQSDCCLFRRDNVWLLHYVDDIVLIGPRLHRINSEVKEISMHLDVKDLVLFKSFLGTLFIQDNNGAWLPQKPFSRQLIQNYNMNNYRVVSSSMVEGALKELRDINSAQQPFEKVKYQYLLGSLRYLSNRARANISDSVGILCRYTSCPTQTHWHILKRF